MSVVDRNEVEPLIPSSHGGGIAVATARLPRHMVRPALQVIAGALRPRLSQP
ncbi:hypothetical protein [Pseudomonas indica]|uniref:Uncharacterized protein n=1 Tax=Pseudomonas indica TaxID=137658 RepID=A0A1G9LTI2_9PSED|nr:hypothetical protein [Pseudomonas indica]SDL65114.1 hypothetical protein SAMN05216186_12628 [Pseudomonas indica]